MHYKGKHQKGSLNYVLVFYRAMQFSRTHFSGRGGLDAPGHPIGDLPPGCDGHRFAGIKSVALPAMEWLLSWAGLVFSAAIRRLAHIRYDWDMALPATGAYAFVWLAAVKLQGGYDQPWRWNAVAKGIVIGTIVLLATYGLLPESLRFSRAIFLFGAGFVPAVIAVVRAIFTRFGGSTGESRRSVCTSLGQRI